MAAGGTDGRGDDDDSRDEFHDYRQRDAEGDAVASEGGVGDGVAVETIDGRSHPDLVRHLLGSGQQETDGGARSDAADHLGDDVENAVKHRCFAGEHRRDGDGGIELRSGDLAKDDGGGRVHNAGQQCDERHVDAVNGGTQRAYRVDCKADDEASDELGAHADGQWLVLFFLGCGLGHGRCFNSSHSLSSVVYLNGCGSWEPPNDCNSTSSSYK